MPARIRNWYSVYRIGDAEPSTIVSAFSVAGVERYLKDNPFKQAHRIIPTSTWAFAKVMSGCIFGLSRVDSQAPNSWYMKTDDQVYHVVILN